MRITCRRTAGMTLSEKTVSLSTSVKSNCFGSDSYKRMMSDKDNKSRNETGGEEDRRRGWECEP